MDPNATLTNARSAAEAFNTAPDTDALLRAGMVLVEAFTALDDWIGTQHGFLPDAWQKPLVPAFGVNPLVDDLLWTVFVVALEGGIGYWAASSSYQIWLPDHKTPDHEGFYSDIVDTDGDDAFEPTRIDRSTLVRAFERMAAGPVEYMPDKQRYRFLAALHARLAGDGRTDFDFDAGDADNIIQVGALGSVVFG
jgi:hypothetical protein